MLKEAAQRSYTTNKKKRNVFIPFENERDSLGRVIKPKNTAKSSVNVLQLFENIKKSTKEYYFKKQFEKMEKKLTQFKQSIREKDIDVDKQISQCFKLGDKLSLIAMESVKNEDKFYMTLRSQINEKVENVRQRVRRNKNSQLKRASKQSCILKDISQDNFQRASLIKPFLFKNVGGQSEMMATFCSTGMKYKPLIQNKRYNPWKKWYKEEEFEVFPGKILKTKCLQKPLR